MVKIIISLLTIFVCWPGLSQHKTLGDAIIVCEYELAECRDTLTRRMLKDKMTLRIGDKHSMFYSNNTYYADSLSSTSEGRQLWGRLMLEAIKKGRPQDRPGAITTSDYLYLNYPEGKITTRTILFTTHIAFEEPYEMPMWQLSDSTKMIAGYVCHNASVTFRGRDYEAWYAVEIPIPSGPWKFHGLPGLILEIYDMTGDYHYCLTSIKTENLLPVKLFDFSDGGYQPTTRLKYLRSKASLYFHGGAEQIENVLTDGLIGNHATMRQTSFRYDFIERDYNKK